MKTSNVSLANAPQGLVTARNATQGLSTVRRVLLDDYTELRTWQRVGEKYGLNRGLVYRVAMEGYDPINPDIRHRLGLPPRPVAVNIYVLAILVCYFKPPRPRIYHRLDTMPRWALRWQLENREEI